MTKYNNSKTLVDGIKFDSRKEANRYQELKLLERAGVIKGLTLQPAFELLPSFKYGEKTIRKLTYKADFQYIDMEKGIEIVEDTKGFRTEVYKIKKKLFLFKYGEKYTFVES